MVRSTGETPQSHRCSSACANRIPGPQAFVESQAGVRKSKQIPQLLEKKRQRPGKCSPNPCRISAIGDRRGHHSPLFRVHPHKRVSSCIKGHVCLNGRRIGRWSGVARRHRGGGHIEALRRGLQSAPPASLGEDLHCCVFDGRARAGELQRWKYRLLYRISFGHLA